MRLQVTEAVHVKVYAKCCLAAHKIVSVKTQYKDSLTRLRVKYETLLLLWLECLRGTDGANNCDLNYCCI
jgi:hypothetical protein